MKNDARMRLLGPIGALCICFVSGGATCSRRAAPMPYPPPPVVFDETPSLAEITNVVNRTQNVRQLSSNTAKVEMLSMPSLPRLSATLNLQRERNFRLRASLPILLGAGLDLGSNDEMFWFEVPEGVSKTLYYARHDEYQQQLQRAILPVDPTWITDALGLVQINPAAVISGPVLRDDGRLEIRESIVLPGGNYQRVFYIDRNAGYVTHQLLYSPSGQLIAQSYASNHAYYEAQQCALPHQVELQLTPAVGPPLEMRIEIGSYAVNQLLSGDPQLFTMPTGASQAVDLTKLGAAPITGPLSTTPASTPIDYTATAPTAYPLRGLK